MEWVFISFSMRSSWPRSLIYVSFCYVSCIVRRILYCSHHLGSPHISITNLIFIGIFSGCFNELFCLHYIYFIKIPMKNFMLLLPKYFYQCGDTAWLPMTKSLPLSCRYTDNFLPCWSVFESNLIFCFGGWAN